MATIQEKIENSPSRNQFFAENMGEIITSKMERPSFFKRLKNINKLFLLFTKMKNDGWFKRLIKIISHPKTNYLMFRQCIDLEKVYRYRDAEANSSSEVYKDSKYDLKKVQLEVPDALGSEIPLDNYQVIMAKNLVKVNNEYKKLFKKL